MIQLVAYDQSGSGQTVLDIADEATISLSYSVAELGDVTTRNSPFSQTFRLPQSEKNNLFFEHWYEVNLSAATFDASKKTRVALYDDGVLVIAGYLQLKDVHLEGKTYTVAVFGDNANLYQEIGDKSLRDAFLTNGVATTDYNYVPTGSNVVDSWDLTNDITSGTVGAGVVIVPLADPGSGGDDFVHYSYTGGLGIGAAGALPAWKLKPAMQLKHLFDKILANAGYSYTSTFLASDTFTKIYMTLASEMQILAGIPVGGCSVGLTSDQTVTEETAVIEFDNESGTFFDDENAWDTTAYTYTAPVDLELACTVTIDVAGTASADAAFYILIETPQGSYTSPEYFVDAPFLPTYSFSQSGIDMNQGEELQVSIVVTSGTIVMDSGAGGTSFYVNGIESAVEQDSVLVTESVPSEIKQADFLKDIIQRFNLILEATQDNERHLIIEPYSDWLDAGGSIDWTGKLDLSKEVVLAPTDKYKKSVIDFRDKEGKDERNEFWQDKQGHSFGRYYEQVDDDFAKGELKNKPVFKPFHVNRVPTNTGGESLIPAVLIPGYYNLDDGVYEPVNDEPSLFYHNGLVDVGATIYVGDQAATQYAYCSAFNETPNDDETTVSLYWGYQYPYGFGTPTMGSDYVSRNLWREYWGRFYNQVYSPDARILTAYFYLTPTDILNLRFNDLIQVKEAHYRLLKIEGYTVNGYEVSKCELIKEVSGLKYDTTDDCDYIPDRWNANGTVRFVNPETGSTTLNPGEACCTGQGFTWDASANLCYWQRPNDGTTRPDNGPGVALERAGSQDVTDTQNYRSPATNAVSRRTVLFADVNEGNSVAASQDGEGNGAIQLPHNTVCRITANVTSTQTTYDGTNGDLGATSFRQYIVIAKNIDGRTTTDITENVDVRTDEVDVTNRAVAVSVVAGPISGLDRNISLTCTGETFARVHFTLDCEVTYTDVSGPVKDQNPILAEDGATLAAENGTILIY